MSADGEVENPELRAFNNKNPEVPEHLRQKISWTGKGGTPPAGVQVRGMQVLHGKEAEKKIKQKTKQKKKRKSKKTKQRYAYLKHGCPKCKKNILIKIPELAVVGFVNQIRAGYVPEVPDGMTTCTVRIPKMREKNEKENGRPTGKN
jgi:hypothetical protein